LYAAAENAKKTTKTSYFEGSTSFEVIDFDTTKKLVTIACYDISSRSAIIFRQNGLIAKNNYFLGMYLYFNARVHRPP